MCLWLATEGQQQFLLNRTLSVQAKEMGKLLTISTQNAPISRLDVKKTMEGILNLMDPQMCPVRVVEEGKELFKSDSMEREDQKDIFGRSDFRLEGRPFSVFIYPTQNFIRDNKSKLPWVILTVGTLIASLAALLAYANQELARSRRSLQKDLQVFVGA